MNIKKDKGSSAIFVLIGMLFMTAFLIITYGNLSNKSKVMAEQYNIISDIYSNGGNTNEMAYEAAYTALRNKNKQTITLEIDAEENDDTDEIVLDKVYAGKLKNYKIYGTGNTNENAVGDFDAISNNYKIYIRVWKKEDDADRTQFNVADYYTDYEIAINSPLLEDEYINYNTKTVTRTNESTEDIENMPELPTYEDYTKIEILTTNAPAKVEIKYTGYTI